MITYKDIKENEEINGYITHADISLKNIGYTEHSFAHVAKTAVVTKEILTKFNYDCRTIEIAQIAAYMHDIGNVINRIDHAQSGAMMSYRILDKLGMHYSELAIIINAIGNHDEETAMPSNPVSAALILADKTDVRRTRVRSKEYNPAFHIHDRVNYAVTSNCVIIDEVNRVIQLVLEIDQKICSVMEYFEIFLSRMVLCKRAADFINVTFKLKINGLDIT